MEVNTNIPVLFQELKTFEADDVRFMKVKIWLMHLQENLNGSFFTKESVVKAMPTLSNTPILVYIEDNENGEKDFSDHRQELKKEDGAYKIDYLCTAIGVIPESNNAQFEFRLCDDGVEREFLTVEGLVWKKWDDPVDIFNRDIKKSQSMELAENYDGFWRKDKLFEFTEFSFFGACGLGIGVSPAMHSSTIELQFDEKSVYSEIQTKMEQFKQFSLDSTSLEVNHIDSTDLTKSNESQIEIQGGDQVDAILEMLAKYSLTLEDLQAKEINHEEFTLEELEEKVKVEFTQDNADNPKKDDNPEQNFALTVSQLQEEVYRALKDFGTVVDEDWGYEYSKYSLADIDTEGSNVVAYDNENWYLIGFNYSVEGDKVSINGDSLKRFKVNYVPMELESEDVTNVFDSAKSRFEQAKEAFATKAGELAVKETSLQELQAEHDTLKAEYAEVSTEYSAKLQADRKSAEEEIFATFAKELTEDEMSEVKAKKSEMELEDIQDKLFALVGKKKAQFNFSKSTKANPINIREIEPEKPVLSGKSYDELFEKYGNQ